jgi:two-component system NtrC family sensor kinase
MAFRPKDGVMATPTVSSIPDNDARFAPTRTLLVLEDDPSVMMLLRLMLEQYSLIEASTAEQALRLFTDHGHQVDLLIADLTLPTSSGIHVALLLRSRTPDLPVILTSGYPVSAWSDGDSADLERLGSRSVAILPKPFQPQVLLETIRQMIGTSQSDDPGTPCVPDQRR